MKINEKELYELYMQWVNKVAEECDWVTTFGPKEIVGAIVRILEQNPHLIRPDSYSPYEKEILDIN